MAGLISICLPTYNRPRLLREAIESCCEQTYDAYEIVIGDDSKDEQSAQLVAHLSERYPGRLRYHRNVPPLGQSANVNDLFARANGERLLLLHDDDVLLPDALALLDACWRSQSAVDAVFGKQYIMSHDGVLLANSGEINARYNRTPENAGRVPVPAVAGILRMFPNNGYVVRTSLARAIGYRAEAEVGPACDTDFGVRFCLAAQNVWFIDDYVMKYRLSNDSITKSTIAQPFAYDVMERADVPPGAGEARRKALTDLAPGAASGFAQLNQPHRALGIFCSSNYTWRKKLSLRGLYHALLIAASFAGAFRRRSAES